jgi:hypothetical protein
MHCIRIKHTGVHVWTSFLIPDTVQYRALINTVTNFRFPQKTGILTSWATISFRNNSVPCSHSVLRVKRRELAQNRYSDWLRAGRPRGRSSSPKGGKNFRFSTSSRLVLGSTQPPIQRVPGALSPGVERPGREDHSPPSTAEIEQIWLYTSTSPYVFMA